MSEKKSRKPMNLRIKKPEDKGYSIWLDKTELHHVEDYEIKHVQGNMAELCLKLLVNFPVQETAL